MDPARSTRVARTGQVDPVSLTRSLVDIDSTTGREGEVATWLAGYLRNRGYQVVEQPIDGTRFNVYTRQPPYRFSSILRITVQNSWSFMAKRSVAGR